MSKYVVSVFPNEAKAYEGVGAFNALHGEHSLTLYGMAVIAKDAEGRAEVKEAEDEGPIGTAIGMMSGALVGVLGGPAGVVIGATGGGLLGSISDLGNTGVGLDFVDMVAKRMQPGTAAVVAEVDEYWTTPLDTRMEALGGEVFRRTRADFEDEQFDQEVTAWNEEMNELGAEMKEASDEIKAKLQAKKDAVRKHLEDAMEKGGQKITQLENEQEAKLAALEKQVAEASADTKAKIEKRMQEVKANYNARLAKLKDTSKAASATVDSALGAV